MGNTRLTKHGKRISDLVLCTTLGIRASCGRLRQKSTEKGLKSPLFEVIKPENFNSDQTTHLTKKPRPDPALAGGGTPSYMACDDDFGEDFFRQITHINFLNVLIRLISCFRLHRKFWIILPLDTRSGILSQLHWNIS